MSQSSTDPFGFLVENNYAAARFHQPGHTLETVATPGIDTSGCADRSFLVEIVHSQQIVADGADSYQKCTDAPHKGFSEYADGSPDSVELVYSTKTYRETFSLLRPRIENLYDPVDDIIKTMHMLVRHTLIVPPQELVELFENSLLPSVEAARNRRLKPDFVNAVAEFNRVYSKCKKDGFVLGYTKRRLAVAADEEKRAIVSEQNAFTAFELVSHLLEQSFVRIVAPAQGHRHYIPESPSPSTVEDVLSALRVKAGSKFVFLGSGIGSTILQVAARTECAAYGIELDKQKAKLAVAQLREFHSRLKFFNRRLGHVELDCGDFLNSAEVPARLRSADIVFVHNLRFDAAKQRRLASLLAVVRDGAEVVALNPLASFGEAQTHKNEDGTAFYVYSR